MSTADIPDDVSVEDHYPQSKSYTPETEEFVKKYIR